MDYSQDQIRMIKFTSNLIGALTLFAFTVMMIA